MDNKTSFFEWAFTNRDADGLIITFLFIDAISNFIRSIVIGIIDPIIESILPKEYHDNVEQVLNVFNITKIRFQLQYILSGLFRMLLTFGIAYLMLKYLYSILSLKIKK